MIPKFGLTKGLTFKSYFCIISIRAYRHLVVSLKTQIYFEKQDILTTNFLMKVYETSFSAIEKPPFSVKTTKLFSRKILKQSQRI